MAKSNNAWLPQTEIYYAWYSVHTVINLDLLQIKSPLIYTENLLKTLSDSLVESVILKKFLGGNHRLVCLTHYKLSSLHESNEAG